ncbi:serine-rich coiled-coil domain-containing protein 2 isoform X2 [Xenopus laevis]|uniref:Serine-rich coiled-coil domain-containing protein 2 isoform X2 n=1 Tax=Xenopus laevis TaxID=8355 RepID=A0A8J0U2X4_XENLA|nr:serine-rich coiled-coil domain-containing protein 2 isoform X2 [Xenopus laevis]
MEEKIQDRSSLATKLPKFGAPKPLGNFLHRTAQSSHTGLLAKSNHTAVENKHTDLDRTSGFSLNWRKLKCRQNEHIAKKPSYINTEKVHDKRFSQAHLATENGGFRFGVTGKNLKQSNMLVPQKQDLNENLLPGPPNSGRLTKNSQFGRTFFSSLNGVKSQVNGYYSHKPPIGLMRPRANSATTRNFSKIVEPADNKKPCSSVRRSQSFSDSVPNSLIPSTHMTRSHSFSREVDTSGQFKTHQVPIRTSVKPALLSRTARQYELPNARESQIKYGFTRTYSSGLRKTNFSNGSDQIVPSGYKITRPSLLKPNRSQLPVDLLADKKIPSNVSSVTENTETGPSRTGGSTDEQNKLKARDFVIDNYVLCDSLEKPDCEGSHFGEDIDELSISSLSSSEKNDLTEDFSDEFLDLEEGNKTLPVESEKDLSEKSSAEFMVKLPEKKEYNVRKTDDWIGMNLVSPYKEKSISPDMGYRDPSSLELSPSDSSDGTYMWDEEGMEPIGNVHPCRSYESSEMNSLDVLNNLDSCDLEDDDLMLDVDLPEDTLFDIGKVENMSHFERTERSLRQPQHAFWKRAVQSLNVQEQYHLSNADNYQNNRGPYLESPIDQRESCGNPAIYSQSPRCVKMMGLLENTVMLDELTLRHMVQDCTSVKTQLLKLKRFLQQEDDSASLSDIQLSVPSTPEPQETEILWRTEDLLNEIRQLKEESKKKDEKIKQLEIQLKTTCKCQRDSQQAKGEKPKQYDKFTQTTWKRNSPQVLQCSSNNPSSSDIITGKLITQAHQEDPRKHGELIQNPCNEIGNVGSTSKVPENELSVLLSTQLKINDVEDSPEESINKDKHVQNPGQLDNKKHLKSKKLNCNNLPSVAVDAKIHFQSRSVTKPMASSSLLGQIPRSTTLRLTKPKIHTTVASQGANSEIQLASTNHSPLQSPNCSKSMVHKIQPTVHSDHFVGQDTINDSSEIESSLQQKQFVNANQNDLLQSNPGSKPQNPIMPTCASKLPTLGSISSQQQVPAVEYSQQPHKQIPKGSMLRPPSFASKLKKPSSTKPDTVHMAPAPPESPCKTSSSIIPRPSPKKEILQEAVASSALKRQSRLPQPKTH